MLNCHLSTFSATNCRPASGYPATTALSPYEWGSLRIRGELDAAAQPTHNSIFFSRIFVVIQSLLKRDQRIHADDLSGRCRPQPGLT
ncbi:MAG: hypothetical protein NW220_16155 [Leptolyngbyaceae cyanobacterium bins.349]|nr:hypothetical protein [Leptolyngbyaceae cyanobacterium bins.349]